MKTTLHKWLATTLALTMTITPLAASAATGAPYRDLGQADTWALDSIYQAFVLGLMSGDGDGNFRPQATITREEVAVVLARAVKPPAAAKSASTFHDVQAQGWSHDAIEAMVQAGLMTGDGDGTFRPTDLITREEMAVLLVKASNLTPAAGDKLSVADRTSISPWAKGYVQTALEQGLLHGDGTNFNPQSHATRQEVAAMMMNLVVSLSANKIGTITSVGEGTLVVDGSTFHVAASLKGLLNPANAAALAGAKIRYETDMLALTKVTYLELTSGGKAVATGQPEFSGNLVLDGHASTITGKLTISADYLTVKNLTVQGDFEISSAVQNDFYSSHLEVTGRTTIRGGDSNTVVFEDAKLQQVNVNKENVRVESKGSTQVSELVLSSNATITADAGVTIPKLTVEAGVTQLQLDAPVQALEVSGKSTKLTLGAHSKIDTLTLPTGSAITDVIPAYDPAKSTIGKVMEKKPDGSTVPVVLPTTPGGAATGGGGGGGGGGSTPAPTPTPDPQAATVKSVRALNTTTVEITFTKSPGHLKAEDVKFDGGLNVYYVNGDGDFEFPTVFVVHTSVQTPTTYHLSYQGKPAGEPFQGIAAQAVGQITMSDGSPAVGKTLYVMVAPFGTSEVTYTDDQGHYALSGLKDGETYYLDVDYDPASKEVPPHSLYFTYYSSDPLPKLSYVKPQAVGRVMTPDGSQSVANAHVSLVRGNEVVTALTDAEGYYRVAYLSPGWAYSIKVEPMNAQEIPYVTPVPFDWWYTAAPETIPTIKMALPNVTGLVKDPQGNPLFGEVVAFRPVSPFFGDVMPYENYFYTDKQGQYRFRLPDSYYTLEVQTYSDQPYGDPQPIQVYVRDGIASPTSPTTANFNLSLAPVLLQGTITYGKGSPAPANTIKLFDSTGKAVYDGFTRIDGTYKIGGVPDGTYQLQIGNSYTQTVTLAKNKILQQNAVLNSDHIAPTLTVETGWNHFRRGEPLQVKSSEAGEIYLVSADLEITDARSLRQALYDKKGTSRDRVTPNKMVSIQTGNLSPGVYRVYAVDASENVSSPTDTYYKFDDQQPVQSLLGTSIGQLEYVDWNEPIAGIEYIPTGTTVSQLLAAVETVPGVQVSIRDYTGAIVSNPDTTPVQNAWTLVTESDDFDKKTYSLKVPYPASPRTVQSVDQATAEPLYGYYGDIYSLSLKPGTTVGALLKAIQLTEGATAEVIEGAMQVPVSDLKRVLPTDGTMSLRITYRGEAQVTSLRFTQAPLSKNLTSTQIGQLDSASVKEIPLGTTIQQLKAALASDAGTTLAVVERQNGAQIQRENKQVNEEMSLLVIATDGTAKSYTLRLADSQPTITDFYWFRDVGGVERDDNGVITKLVANSWSKATQLKQSVLVPFGSHVEILDGPGGHPLIDPDHTNLTSQMVVRVTSMKGVVREYAIVVN
ncbi:S-layer homology domain-containing protein [Tumebacillus permanentifrigoris]|uniref:S-layer family protein n=1 Tax=Tumebacillus permanentifrigoris TaxID=378543 RepID=A0A316D7U3_9BACL|nr:S-layer homology domain-containing protein [Tumebacillus permanentifrigoris]PWK09651.1 S-layer family protein [Tumebacillus permanentifrigoris]